ncbi:MAG: quinone oxidoreductase [Gammaproteobacteria bacterium CG11_big_fil_rev_8_21_14_0_20_46_22]|nr:MAG: quinone oxidoreductase [Gammaproteobacteria bacterium CG12_big_fil_rev_8_21_14_0_65_46_12]PIR11213.1 MAG: quinone oxidoreductase [Gammaproteobacteria bacterium CG11_big_fil_rev_8_21_14_0_20_46_22]
MKAIQFKQFGEPDVLKLVSLATPENSKNEVLIKVHAAALNPIDYKIREGSSFVSKKLKDHLPSGLGYDFSGEVVGLGNDVSHFDVGDKVMGLAGFPDHPCCYAQYLCASPDTIIKKPANVSYSKAAALTTAGLTALQALKLSHVKAGDTVLIHAGAGGVGHLAIQLAKQIGAAVITTASKKNHDFLQALGADQCIDYGEEDFRYAIGKPVDVVIDLVGGDVGAQSIDCLAANGILVTVPTITAEKVIAAAKDKNRKALGLLKKDNMEDLRYLADLANEKKLKVEISHQFRLNEAIAAHQLLESGHVRGKLVFNMESIKEILP